MAAEARGRWRRIGAGWLLAAGALNAHAGWPAWAHCPTPAVDAAQEWDVHLQLADLIQQEWRARSAPVALISRSGLPLQAIGHRYSHSGFLRAPATEATALSSIPSVRQLYFDCETAQPRVFDEGLAAFVREVARDAGARYSVVWWPAEPAHTLARAVSHDAQAAALVAPRYQAQAHVWSLHTQNCNQWLVEMLAAAFGGRDDRAGAQQWLREQGYVGSIVQLPGLVWLLAAAVMPHMGLQHHPESDRQAWRFEVSLPASVEHFVQRLWPQAQRVEWCLRGHEVVVRRGWQPLDGACTPQDGDERRTLLR